jgi:hypothetical protein
MLKKVHQVDWGSLHHAYGPAKDIPQQIYKLRSKDEKVWWTHFNKLSNNILYRDKYIFEATSYAVPFLIKLVEDENILFREHLLHLLAGIANGTSNKVNNEHLFFIQRTSFTRKEQLEFQKELEWVKKAKLAVYQGIPIFFRLSQHDNYVIKEAAIYTLSSIKWLEEDILKQLRLQLLQEKNPMVLTNLVLALGAQQDQHAQTIHILERYLALSEQPLLQLAAAIALTQIQSGHISRETSQVLIQTIKNPDRVLAYDNLLFAKIDVITDIGRLLSQLPKEESVRSLSYLIDAFLHTENALAAVELTRSILTIAFGEMKHVTSRKASDLTEQQRIILKHIADSKVAWTFNANMSRVLQEFLLPSDLTHLRQFLKEG